MLPQYEPPHRAARDDREGVAADRADRLRRPSGPRHAAARAGRPQERLDGRPRLRGRQRGLLAASRTFLDTALDLLRLSGRRPARSGGRRPRIRRPGGRHGASPSRCSFSPPRRRTGFGARAPGPARRWRRSRCARAASWSARATTMRWRVTATAPRWLIYLLAGVAGGDRDRALPRPGAGGLRAPGDVPPRGPAEATGIWWPLPVAAASTGGIGALAWTAFKVGALSFGGGFVIIPLMQQDAVHVYHWMSDAQFLNAVALGQVTPGPVVATVAAVGYAAHGVGGGAARRGGRVRSRASPSSCSAAVASSGCAETTGRGPSWTAPGRRRSARSSAPPSPSPAASTRPGRSRVLAAAAVSLLVARRGVVETLVASGGVGARGADGPPSWPRASVGPKLGSMEEGTATAAVPEGLGASGGRAARPPDPDQHRQPARQRGPGPGVPAEGSLTTAGFECELLEAEPGRPNLVARLRGASDGPTLTFLGHVDTVRADPDEWSFDPWAGDVADGWVRGRGALDMKGQVASEVAAAAVALGGSGWRPPAGELHAGDHRRRGGRRRARGAVALRSEQPDAVRSDFVVNEGGGQLVEFGGPAPLHAQRRGEGDLPDEAADPRRGRATPPCRGSATTRCSSWPATWRRSPSSRLPSRPTSARRCSRRSSASPSPARRGSAPGSSGCAPRSRCSPTTWSSRCWASPSRRPGPSAGKKANVIPVGGRGPDRLPGAPRARARTTPCASSPR